LKQKIISIFFSAFFGKNGFYDQTLKNLNWEVNFSWKGRIRFLKNLQFYAVFKKEERKTTFWT
jgi:hypothetical protein